MIQDPQVGDVVTWDQDYPYYKQSRLLGKEQWVITAVTRRGLSQKPYYVSVATLHKVNGKHTKSYSGISPYYLIRHEFLSTVNKATKGKRSAA